MIALFDEPIRISIKADHLKYHRNGLLLGLTDSPLEGIVCLEDGEITRLDVYSFLLDYRYNVEKDTWEDASLQKDDDLE